MADFVDFDVEDGCPVDVDMRNLVELLEDDEEFQEIDNLPSDVSTGCPKKKDPQINCLLKNTKKYLWIAPPVRGC